MTGRPDDLGIMTGSYALDAVDDIERAEMDAAIGLSDELRAEVDSLRDTALLLAYATAPVEPSPDLKSSLMAKIALTPQLAPVPAPDAAPAVQATDSGLEAQDQPAPSLQTVGGGSAAATARRRWFQRPASILTAAAAAVVIFVGGGLGITAALQGDNGGQAGQTQASSQLDSIYAAADFQRSSTPVTGGGTATVVWSRSVGKSGVILDGVNTLPKDKTYELWYIGSKIVPAGLVSPTGSGVTSAVLTGKLSGTPTVGVTVEPAGGSKQPTTKPIVAVPTTTASSSSASASTSRAGASDPPPATSSPVTASSSSSTSASPPSAGDTSATSPDVASGVSGTVQTPVVGADVSADSSGVGVSASTPVGVGADAAVGQSGVGATVTTPLDTGVDAAVSGDGTDVSVQTPLGTVGVQLPGVGSLLGK